MKLYEINSQLRNLFDEETGEVLLSDEEIEKLEIARDEKISNIGRFIKEVKMNISNLQEIKKDYEAKITRENNKLEWLKTYLNNNLNGEKFKDEHCSIYYMKTKSVEINKDIEEIYKEMSKEEKRKYFKVTLNVNKQEMKKAIEDGESFDGVTLQENTSIVVR